MKKVQKFKGNELLTSAALIVIGLLFIIFKGGIIGIAMTFVGVSLIVFGVLDMINKLTISGIIKIVFGVLVLSAGWLVVELALYILGAFLLIAGVSELLKQTKVKIKKITLPVVIRIAQPIIYILAGICLFFNQGGAISWVFTVSGIFLVVDGVIGLLGLADKK